MKYGLTPRQKKVFDFVKSYMKTKPVAPTYQEMADAAGLKSKSGIHKLIKNLEARGWLKTIPGKNRSIHIIK
nr:repressor LexA (TIGR00498) [uncultured Mediterranean phage uvMED]